MLLRIVAGAADVHLYVDGNLARSVLPARPPGAAAAHPILRAPLSRPPRPWRSPLLTPFFTPPRFFLPPGL